MTDWDKAEREIYHSILTRNPEHSFVLKLDRVRAAAELLGDPQLTYKTVHVAGTNGKTSTARMIETLVREHGLRTGLFTSPHLASVRERIQIDGEPISAERFVTSYREIEPVLDLVDQRSEQDGGPRLSFFETLTLLAFAAFADAPVDVAVIEVGMGGREDATNILDSEVQVITPISLDHMQWLGPDIATIAGEKAGIIQDNVVVSVQHESAELVLRQAVSDAGATAVWEGQDYAVAAREQAVGGQLLDIKGLAGVYHEIYVPLFGEHQASNAATALVAGELLLTGGEALDEETVQQAFAQVTSPGRLELVRSSPVILVDAAHNPAGMAASVDAIREAFRFTRLVGVVGVMADKDADGILGELEPLLDEVVVTEALTSRALPTADLAAVAADIFDPDAVHPVPRLDEAIALAVDLAEGAGESDPAVLITGSIYLVGEARTLLHRT